MEALLATGSLPPRAQAFVYYGIGKELEDLEDWDSAFTAFASGARARRGTLQYDEAREVATFETLGELYTRQWLQSRPPGCDDSSPIFIVGQPRTGTTLVERIVSSHSAVHSAGELQQFGNCIRRMTDYDQQDRFSPELFSNAVDIDPEALGEQYLLRTTRPVSYTHLTLPTNREV